MLVCLRKRTAIVALYVGWLLSSNLLAALRKRTAVVTVYVGCSLACFTPQQHASVSGEGVCCFYCVCWLAASRTSNMLACLGKGSAQRIARAVTPKQKLQLELVALSHSIRTAAVVFAVGVVVVAAGGGEEANVTGAASLN